MEIPTYNTIDKYINKKKVVRRITKTITTKQINHETVSYNGHDYIVCYTPYNDNNILFVIDADDRDKIINKSWHYRNDGRYIASPYVDIDDNRKELYLHNVVMNRLTFEGKGQQQIVDHINRIGRDNRKCNLRIVQSQSAQNFNQKKRERKIELPDNCGFTSDMIPKNVYYCKPNGNHGDCFSIELKGIKELNDGKFIWKSTKSKAISLVIKLRETLDKLTILKNQYPILNDIIITDTREDIRSILITEFNDILKLSHYPPDIIFQNLEEFESETTDVPDIQINESEILQKINSLKESGKHKNNLPLDCGVTIEMIPKYCYYVPKREKRGDKFVIERHPDLLKINKRQWSTSESNALSTIDKFNLMMNKLSELAIQEIV